MKIMKTPQGVFQYLRYANFAMSSIELIFQGSIIGYRTEDTTMTAINKKVLSEIVAEEHNLTKKEAAQIIDLVFDTISSTLKDGNKVEITGFGKFEIRERAGRTGINPHTKEPIEIAPVRIPAFRASKNLKEYVK